MLAHLGDNFTKNITGKKISLYLLRCDVNVFYSTIEIKKHLLIMTVPLSVQMDAVVGVILATHKMATASPKARNSNTIIVFDNNAKRKKLQTLHCTIIIMLQWIVCSVILFALFYPKPKNISRISLLFKQFLKG